MQFKEIQEMLHNNRLNEDFLDDFKPDEKRETTSSRLARESLVENNSTFRVTTSAKVDSN